jgi:hypothetical protein
MASSRADPDSIPETPGMGSPCPHPGQGLPGRDFRWGFAVRGEGLDASHRGNRSMIRWIQAKLMIDKQSRTARDHFIRTDQTAMLGARLIDGGGSVRVARVTGRGSDGGADEHRASKLMRKALGSCFGLDARATGGDSYLARCQRTASSASPHASPGSTPVPRGVAIDSPDGIADPLHEDQATPPLPLHGVFVHVPPVLRDQIFPLPAIRAIKEDCQALYEELLDFECPFPDATHVYASPGHLIASVCAGQYSVNRLRALLDAVRSPGEFIELYRAEIASEMARKEEARRGGLRGPAPFPASSPRRGTVPWAKPSQSQREGRPVRRPPASATSADAESPTRLIPPALAIRFGSPPGDQWRERMEELKAATKACGRTQALGLRRESVHSAVSWFAAWVCRY